MKRILLISASFLCTACTDNSISHQFGGVEEITLRSGEHFVDSYWDGNSHLWYLTRPVTPADAPPTIYIMHEKSSYGVWEGTVVFHETR